MKIMIVTPYFSPKIGGLENYALNIALGLNRIKGNEVVIVTSNQLGSRPVEEFIKGLRVIRLPYRLTFSNTPIDIRWYWQMRNIIRKEKPDVINAHSPVPFMADIAINASNKIPTVLTYHVGSLKKEGSPALKIMTAAYLLFQRITFRKSTRIIAVSDYVRNSFPSKYQSKTIIVSNAVDSVVTNMDKINRLKNQLIFIGSLDKSHSWKGLSNILISLSISIKTHPDLKLIVLGDGNMRDEYVKQCLSLGIQNNVIFKGFIEGTKKNNILSESTALVMYPQSSNDAFPTVLLEAWASGTPVIAAKIGALKNLITDQLDGILVNENDCEELATTIGELVEDDYLRDKLSMVGKRRIEDGLTWEKSVSTTYELFKELTLPKVAIIHNIISPYRLPLFEVLSTKYDLTVYFCKVITKDRAWNSSIDNYSFKHKVLRGFSIGPIIFNYAPILNYVITRPDIIIANSDPDVLVSAVSAIVYSKLYRKRFILWSEVGEEGIYTYSKVAYKHNFIYDNMRSILKKIVISYRTIYFKYADSFLAFSNYAKNFLLNHGVENSKIAQSLQIVPETLLVKARSSYKRSGMSFIYVGYLNDRKNVETLIKDFMEIKNPKATLTIVGSGPQQMQLMTLASQDKRIKFTGYLDNQDKADFYCKSDVLILPTLSDSWGLVINESIHYGLAIICSQYAAASEIVDSSVGIIVGPSHVSSYLLAMEWMLTNHKEMIQMQKHNAHMTSINSMDEAVEGFHTAIRLATT